MAITDKIVKIADKTRELTGLTNKMTLDEIPTNMDLIKSVPNLQDKSITMTENGTQTIQADEGYDGLNKVDITVDVASSGGESTIEKGIIVNACHSNGLVKEVTVVGFTSLPTNMFYVSSTNSSSNSYLNRAINKINLPNNLTAISSQAFVNNASLKEVNLADTIQSIGDYAFRYCSSLILTEFPTSLNTFGAYAFQGCTKITVKKIPDGVTSMTSSVFEGCSSITQLSMKNVATFTGTSSTNGSIRNCTGLKAVWIGSTVNSLLRYTFNNCSSMQKLFIDKPRATVEGWANYTYAFSNNAFSNSCIVCNDDEGFMTKEEFDAIDWATYTE